MRKVSIGLGAIAAICALAVPASALAATSPETLTLTPSATGKLGGPGKIVVGFSITTSTAGGIPAPLTGPFVEKLPAGIVETGVGFPTCSEATIQAATGATPPTCPAGSLAGSGTSTVQALIGSSPLIENSVVKAYLVSAHPLTLGFWANGTTPIQSTVFFNGTLGSAAAPFGSTFTSTTPVIPTVPGGPNASVTAFSLTLGTTTTVKKGKKKVTISSVTLPKKCTGSLHWSASDSYTDGTSNTATATTPCPK